MILTSCASHGIFQNYPSYIQPLKHDITSKTTLNKSNDYQDALDSADIILYAQELGRAAQIQGNFEQSITYYRQAIKTYDDGDYEAYISASGIAETSSSLLINDKTRGYRGTGFERMMLHQYQALNYLMLNQLDKALIETRRVNELQKIERRRLDDYNKVDSDLDNGIVLEATNKLKRKHSTLQNSLMNSYNYYTTGLIHELSGKPNDAYIDFRKAARLNPEQSYLHQDLTRLSKKLRMPQYEQFKKQWGEPRHATKNEGQLIVLYEKDFIAKKKAITLPLWILGDLQQISLPAYSEDKKLPYKHQFSQATFLPPCESVADMDQLAISALEEQYPGIITRQVARYYSKHQMNKLAGDGALGLAVQVFNIISEQADLRSWLTLPKQAFIGRSYLKEGEYFITDSQESIKIVQNKTTFVWIIQVNDKIRYYSTTI